MEEKYEEMNMTMIKLLKNSGLNPAEFLLVTKTCDNAKFKHIKSGKYLDIRW